MLSMRSLLLLAALACLLAAPTAQAAIDWAGNAYPNNGHAVLPSGDQFVVAQVYKGGVTDGEGQGADLAADLIYDVDGTGPVAVAMAYNTDIGNNDEYIGYIPQAALMGASYVDVTVIFHDATDDTQFEITGDQEGNPPPLRYDIVAALPNDVDVVFTLCMSGEPFTGAPCVIGSADVIGDWVDGVPMTQLDGDLWEIVVTFPAGTNPTFDYKYKKDDCSVWEDLGNRTVTLPSDGTTLVNLEPDSWNDLPIGCGLGEVLEMPVEVCFQVCMDGIETTGDVCVIGGHPDLGDWVDGVVMDPIGPMLYQACIMIPEGQAVPLSIEYKFKKDGCETWESLPDNRVVTIDLASPAEITMTHNWDDNPDGACDPVRTEPQSWTTVKGLF
jgi:hypothetical protein